MNEKVGCGAAAAGPTPGELLQQERVLRGLSLQEAAESLHLETWVIEALEANRFDALGAPVFARGHLRKYAALLGLPESRVLERYAAVSEAAEAPTLIPTTHGRVLERHRSLVGWLAGLLVLILAGGLAAWWWLGAVSTAPEPATRMAPATPTDGAERGRESEPVATPVVSTPRTEDVPTEPSVAEEAGEPAVAEEVEATADSQTATEALADPDAEPVRVGLTFTDSCWVEVTDATGRQLMFDVGQPGTARELEGQAPIRVLLGYAPGVTVVVNGELAEIPPRRRAGDVARFEVAADGSLQ